MESENLLLGALSSILVTSCLLVCAMCNYKRKNRSFRIDDSLYNHPSETTHIDLSDVTEISAPQGLGTPVSTRQRPNSRALPETPEPTPEPTYVNYPLTLEDRRRSCRILVSTDPEPEPVTSSPAEMPAFRPVYALTEREKEEILQASQRSTPEKATTASPSPHNGHTPEKSPRASRVPTHFQPELQPIPRENYFRSPTLGKRHSDASDYSSASHYGKKTLSGMTGSSQYCFAGPSPAFNEFADIAHLVTPFRTRHQHPPRSSPVHPLFNQTRLVPNERTSAEKLSRLRLTATSQSPAVQSYNDVKIKEECDNPFFYPRRDQQRLKKVKRSPVVLSRGITINEDYGDPFDAIPTASKQNNNTNTPPIHFARSNVKIFNSDSPTQYKASPVRMVGQMSVPPSPTSLLKDVTEDETYIYVLPFDHENLPNISVQEYI